MDPHRSTDKMSVVQNRSRRSWGKNGVKVFLYDGHLVRREHVVCGPAWLCGSYTAPVPESTDKVSVVRIDGRDVCRTNRRTRCPSYRWDYASEVGTTTVRAFRGASGCSVNCYSRRTSIGSSGVYSRLPGGKNARQLASASVRKSALPCQSSNRIRGRSSGPQAAGTSVAERPDS